MGYRFSLLPTPEQVARAKHDAGGTDGIPVGDYRDLLAGSRLSPVGHVLEPEGSAIELYSNEGGYLIAKVDQDGNTQRRVINQDEAGTVEINQIMATEGFTMATVACANATS